jgi:hypothetical protein
MNKNPDVTHMQRILKKVCRSLTELMCAVTVDCFSLNPILFQFECSKLKIKFFWKHGWPSR